MNAARTGLGPGRDGDAFGAVGSSAFGAQHGRDAVGYGIEARQAQGAAARRAAGCCACGDR